MRRVIAAVVLVLVLAGCDVRTWPPTHRNATTWPVQLEGATHG